MLEDFNNTSDHFIIPKRIFIVPYRNRIQHKFFFSKYMTYILEDKNDYEIFFSHQCDARTFNRGAVKNIGFIAARNKYPQHYKDITFIFNDVDTIPFSKIFDYQTTTGIVKHYYGFEYALGGIVVMKGSDFEKINGFPCFWGWGMEDNVLQKRCNKFGLIVDRSLFYKIGSPEILQLFDGISRIISKKDPWRGEYDDGTDGLSSITQLKYSIDDISDNPNDNLYVVNNKNIKFINIKTFLTKIPFGSEEYYSYDLREPKRKIINPDKIKETKKIVSSTTDWSNIPYYPTTREKRENLVKYLIQMGRQIPAGLLKQINEDRIKDTEEDVYNNFSNSENTKEYNDPYNKPYNEQYNKPYNEQYNKPYNEQYNKPSNEQYLRQKPPHKFSPQYANYIGAKPKATTSVRVRLGGIF